MRDSPLPIGSEPPAHLPEEESPIQIKQWGEREVTLLEGEKPFPFEGLVTESVPPSAQELQGPTGPSIQPLHAEKASSLSIPIKIGEREVSIHVDLDTIRQFREFEIAALKEEKENIQLSQEERDEIETMIQEVGGEDELFSSVEEIVKIAPQLFEEMKKERGDEICLPIQVGHFVINLALEDLKKEPKVIVHLFGSFSRTGQFKLVKSGPTIAWTIKGPEEPEKQVAEEIQLLLPGEPEKYEREQPVKEPQILATLRSQEAGTPPSPERVRELHFEAGMYKLLTSSHVKYLARPNIVRVIVREQDGAFKAQGPALRGKFYEGGALFDYIRDPSFLDDSQRAVFAHQALEFLDSMEKAGWIHGDIKTQNALVTFEHGKLQLRFTDLATCRKRSKKSIQFQKRGGSPGYLAPELFHDSKDGTLPNPTKQDVFAMGVFLDELLHEKSTKPDLFPISLSILDRLLIQVEGVGVSFLTSSNPMLVNLENLYGDHWKRAGVAAILEKCIPLQEKRERELERIESEDGEDELKEEKIRELESTLAQEAKKIINDEKEKIIRKRQTQLRKEKTPLAHITAEMIEPDPSKRPTAADALKRLGP